MQSLGLPPHDGVWKSSVQRLGCAKASTAVRTPRGSGSSFRFFFQAEDGIRDKLVTGVQTCALPICVLERRRRHHHAAAGHGLEELYAGRIDDVVELIAYHYGRSADAEQAVDYAIRAGEKAQRRWATTEALAHFEAALKRLETMPDTLANRLRKIDAVVKQSEIKFALGQHAEHVQALESIRTLTEDADPPRRLA